MLHLYALTSSSRSFYHALGLWHHIMWHVMWLQCHTPLHHPKENQKEKEIKINIKSEKLNKRKEKLSVSKSFHNIESFRICLRCLHTSLLGPCVNELLHLVNALVNSSSKNRFHVDFVNNSNSLRTSSSMKQCWAILNVKCSAYHRLSISKHGWLLYLTASIASNLCLLTQFMSSQGPRLLFEISWILRSKKCCFIFLTVQWNCF